MAVKEILKIGNDTLRKTSHPVEKFNLRLWLLLRDMADTMYKAEGVGLAGPQIGILRRVVALNVLTFTAIQIQHRHAGSVNGQDKLLNPRSQPFIGEH